MSAILSVRNLEASYGRAKALHGLNFEVRQGGVTALLGSNGAGKTTTLRAICGMISRKGTIRFASEELTLSSTDAIARLGIAHIPSDRGTIHQMTTEENLRLGATTRTDRDGIAADLEMVFDYFPILQSRRRQQAGTLSGGEQQMLAISRALMLRPKLLLLDEPSFGLAPMIVQEIYRILRKIRDTQNVSMLLVEQNAHLALDLADHAYLLETGRMAVSGAADSIRDNEQIRHAYLGL